MQASRRTLLKGGLATGIAAVAAGAGLLTPQLAMATWPKAAFGAKNVDAAT
ncbi:MAG TPA: twin-arginine translocation signal domain-containing protein, partial [Gammaproteobacteria bacterium]|nr:twin-arginine translocation signal domain-containing protein [Gammaproteobacteria bacterium]